jgi:hypothetical protein
MSRDEIEVEVTVQQEDASMVALGALKNDNHYIVDSCNKFMSFIFIPQLLDLQR